MKTITRIFCSMTMIFLFACQKDQSSTSLSRLEASVTETIKIGQPVLFTLTNTDTSRLVSFSVKPNTNVHISTNGNKASVKFGSFGKFTVTAVNGGVSFTKSVTVIPAYFTLQNDTLSASQVSFLQTDTLFLDLYKIDSGVNKIRLQMNVATALKYQCFMNYLNASFTSSDTVHNLTVRNVMMPSNCGGGVSSATGFFSTGYLAQGSNRMTIQFNGKIYTGNIANNNGALKLSWPHSSGVIIRNASL